MTAPRSTSHDDTKHKSFRLVTYNIHKGIGGADRRYRLERIVETLRHCHPDIAFLQEVDDGVPRSKRHHQVTLLAEALGFEHQAFQRNVKLKEGGYGNAILSRFPLAQVHNIDLSVRFKKRRRALMARCLVPKGSGNRSIQVANVHLGLSGLERQLQLRRLLKHRLFSDGSGHLPTLVGGDYNDVWGRLGKGIMQPAGFEPASRRVRTFPAIMPLRPLDRIFYQNLRHVHHAFACHTRVARQASDHLPLVADFEFLDSRHSS